MLLVVAERHNGQWIPVAESSDVTGLGEGMAPGGVLAEASIARTLHAIEEACERARSYGAQQVAAVATMAVRMASNADEFLKRAQQQGTPVVVLSGDDEAELGFRSVADDPLFAGNDRISTVDVGGQSTEIAVSERSCSDWATRFRRSFPIGTLALRSRILSEEAPDQASRMRAVKEIDEILGISFRPSDAGLAVALGATATNLITIREKMVQWNPESVHGEQLSYEEISRASGWLCSMTDVQRAALPGLERGRERTIHIGALILERCLFALRVEECAVSVRGWRHAFLEDDARFSRSADQ